MARIPLGGAGNRMPASVRPPQIAEAGVQTGRALERLGTTGVEVGLQKERDRLQVDWQKHDEQQRLAEKAAQAQDAAAVGMLQDRMREVTEDIGKGVIAGTIPKADGEKTAAERLRKLVDESLPSFREQSRSIVQPQVERHLQIMLGGVRNAREERDRRDVTVAFDQILEQEQRNYSRDPAGATARVDAAAKSLLPFSTYAPEVGARKLQSWKEGSQYTVGFAAVEAARNDPKALDQAAKMLDTLPDLDPQKRAQLNDWIADSRMRIEQKRELAAQRAARQAEAALKKAEATFTAATALADKGILAPEFADATLQRLSGTPYASAFRELVNQQAVTGNLAAMPIRAQQSELDRVNAQIAQSGITPALEKRRTQLEKVVTGSRADLDRDPLRAGLERGVITKLDPLDVSTGVPDLMKQLQGRVLQSDVVSSWAGRPVSPLTVEEAGALKQRLDTLPAKDKSQFIAATAQALGPKASQGLAEQLDKKDRALALAFAKAGDMTTESRLTSELILKGQQAKSDGTSTKDEKKADLPPSQWRAALARNMRGRDDQPLYLNASLEARVLDAAEFIAHGIATEQGGRLSKDDMKRAVGLALGGSLIEHNGKRIPIPAGKTEADLERSLSRFKPEAIPGGTVRVNGAPMPAAEFVKTLPGQKLVPVATGRYNVEVGGRLVVDSAGTPIVIGIE